MATIGYARVSTEDQNLDLQLDALHKAGADPIYEERASGKAGGIRPVRDQMLRELQAGDTLTVWKLDRLGRSIIELHGIVSDLARRSVKFRSLTESIDTSSAQGWLFFVLLAAFAEFERNQIIERTKAGQAQRRANGLHPGGSRMYGLGEDRATVVEAEATRLREAAAHLLDDKPLLHLVDAWNAASVPTKSGKGRWSETTLRRMLANPRVEPILGAEVYAQVVRRLAPARERQRQGRPAEHLLSGVLVCGACGHRMYYGVGSGGRDTYRCKRPFGGRYENGCGGTNISARGVEGYVTDAVAAMVCEEEFVERVNARRAALLSGGVSTEQLADMQAKVADLETVLSTQFGTPEHQALHDELARRVREATRQLLARPDLELLADLPRTEEKFRARWASSTVAEQRRLLKALLRQITVRPTGGVQGRRFNPERLDPDWRI